MGATSDASSGDDAASEELLTGALAKLRLAERLTREQLGLSFDPDLSRLAGLASFGDYLGVAVATLVSAIEETGDALVATVTYPGVAPIDLLQRPTPPHGGDS